MTGSLYSPHWYRVAKLKPKLFSHIEVHRHDYRGLIWYIMEDTSSGRNHRFNPAAYQLIGLLDGQRSVQEISDLLNKQLGDFAPGQEEIIQLMGQLYSADLIQTNALVNIEELFDRHAKFKDSKFKQRFINPLSQKVPLWDPEVFLDKYQSKVAWLFSRWMAAIWLLVVAFSTLQAVTHWTKITDYFDVNAVAPNNLLMMFLLYPPIKIFHELGHAFVTKLKGGEVHEMGINFMMFMPVPYVNVSSSGHFRNKYDRMLVSAAGILIETFLAALGLLLFLNTEPGFVQQIGFTMLLIGGVSSLFFNGNPLLKYDGYYILADMLGIPNLFQRSMQYWRYFFQRHLIGITLISSPASAPNETAWFIVYSIASLLYRLSILWFICIYVTEKFFTAGVLLAFWLVGAQIISPVCKAISFVLTSPVLGKKRSQAVIKSFIVGLAVLALFGFMPFPSYTLAEGIVWLPDEAQIKAEQDGFIDELKVHSHQYVERGDVVLVMSDDTLKSKARIARAKLTELQSQYRAERESDLVKAGILKQEFRVAQAELENINAKLQALVIKSAKQGYVLLPEIDDLPGRFVHHGESIGYVVNNNESPTIRMAVLQENIGQLRESIADIKVRLISAPGREYAATMIRQTPEATHKVPSATLTTLGGGKIAVDPNNKKELLALQKIFLVDLRFNPTKKDIPIGTRAFVRINHGGEPLSVQWFRRIRQAFLRHFNV